MKHIWNCRRTFISFFAILCLTIIGIYTNNSDVAIAISGVAAALAGANAFEGSKKNKKIEKDGE